MPFEFWMMIGSFVTSIIGGFITAYKCEIITIANVFGYHEIFHILVVFAGITIYLVNWSIIRRISNPYHHDTEIIKAIMKNIYIHD